MPSRCFHHPRAWFTCTRGKHMYNTEQSKKAFGKSHIEGKQPLNREEYEAYIFFEELKSRHGED